MSTGPTGGATGGLVLLVVDDEQPALDDLSYLLDRDARVARVSTSRSATEALALLRAQSFDGVLLDVEMPGLSGLELAAVIARMAVTPPIVFVTAHDEHAVEAFDVRAVDFLLKPVREERLREAVRRIADEASVAAAVGPTDETIPVERGGVTRFVARSEVRFVSAQGDYVRLHTATDTHLLRVPLTELQEQWADAGFVRIHRSLLVALAHVGEVWFDGGRCWVRVGDHELQVSRRHTRELRERIRRTGSHP